MDSNDHRRRQSNPSGYASQQGLLQTSPQYPPTSVPDRFRQSSLHNIHSPTSAPSAARGGGGGGGGSNIQGYNYPYGEGAAAAAQFGASSMSAQSMQYQSEYGSESQRQPAQSYTQYGSSNLMYNATPGAQPQASPQTAYDSVQPYQQPRQSTAIEVLSNLSNQFAVPQQYYVAGAAGEAGPASAPVQQQSVGSAQYHQGLSYANQNPAAAAAAQGRDSISSAYGMADATQNSQSGYAQQSGSAAAGYGASELDSVYGQYQSELKRAFERVRDGRLAEAGDSLVSISEWLLGNAEALGLVRDDEAMHADRLKLWEQFNTAWLAALQTQKEMTLEMTESGQRPSAPRSLMESDQMENMGKELVRLCDIMEKHGLVDYQMGVWEEEIIGLLNTCLDLLEDLPSSRSSTQRRR